MSVSYTDSVLRKVHLGEYFSLKEFLCYENRYILGKFPLNVPEDTNDAKILPEKVRRENANSWPGAP